MRDHRKDPGKYIGSFTCRGSATETEVETNGPIRIRLFDGKFDTAYRVREFYVFAATWSSSTTPDCVGKLSTSPNSLDTPVNFMDASDSRAIAWSGTSGGLDTAPSGSPFTIVDPENLVVEDLWVYVRGSQDAANISYMVVLDKYDITDAMGAVTMAKDRANDSEGQWIA